MLHYLRLFQVSSNKTPHILSTISNSFHSMQHCINTQVNQRLNIWLHSLCVPLLPRGRNQQPHLLSSLYNIYVNFNKPTILYHVVSQISTFCIMINFCHFMFLLVWNLLRISKPYILCFSKDKLQNSYLKNKVFSWGKCCINSLNNMTLHSHYAQTLLTTTYWSLKLSLWSDMPLHFLLWKGYYLFFTPITLFSSTLGILLSLYDMKNFLRDTHQEWFARTTTSKWSFLLICYSKNIKCIVPHDLHQTDRQELHPIGDKLLHVLLQQITQHHPRSHSIPCHWHLSFIRIFEFPLPIPLSSPSHS